MSNLTVSDCIKQLSAEILYLEARLEQTRWFLGMLEKRATRNRPAKPTYRSSKRHTPEFSKRIDRAIANAETAQGVDQSRPSGQNGDE